MTGKRQVGYIASAERGQLLTVVTCASATGNYVPSVVLFPRKKINPLYKRGMPPDTECFPSDTGWMTGPLFLQWLKLFV